MNSLGARTRRLNFPLSLPFNPYLVLQGYLPYTVRVQWADAASFKLAYTNWLRACKLFHKSRVGTIRDSCGINNNQTYEIKL